MNKPIKGRGAVTNPDNRFAEYSRREFDDGWDSGDGEPEKLATTLISDASKTIIAYNDSPDIPFDRSINPYRGCEHGCIYCYARPSHAWLGYSPGLDFETQLHYKPQAVELLRQELSAKNYQCAPMALGANTDCYQPIERKLKLTRGILGLLKECRHPAVIISKSSLLERDLDLLKELAKQHLIQVMISITTLDATLARSLEPRAASPSRRLKTIESLANAEVPVGVLVAPVIPVLTDPEMEKILQAAREAGAATARKILLRLPMEVAPLFTEWLQSHVPGKASHVLQRIRDTRDGELYRSGFSQRMSGSGVYAELLEKRFNLALKRYGFAQSSQLDCSRFCKPAEDPDQMSLF